MVNFVNKASFIESGHSERTSKCALDKLLFTALVAGTSSRVALGPPKVGKLGRRGDRAGAYSCFFSEAIVEKHAEPQGNLAFNLAHLALRKVALAQEREVFPEELGTRARQEKARF